MLFPAVGVGLAVDGVVAADSVEPRLGEPHLHGGLLGLVDAHHGAQARLAGRQDGPGLAIGGVDDGHLATLRPFDRIPRDVGLVEVHKIGAGGVEHLVRLAVLRRCGDAVELGSSGEDAVELVCPGLRGCCLEGVGHVDDADLSVDLLAGVARGDAHLRASGLLRIIGLPAGLPVCLQGDGTAGMVQAPCHVRGGVECQRIVGSGVLTLGDGELLGRGGDLVGGLRGALVEAHLLVGADQPRDDGGVGLDGLPVAGLHGCLPRQVVAARLGEGPAGVGVASGVHDLPTVIGTGRGEQV